LPAPVFVSDTYSASSVFGGAASAIVTFVRLPEPAGAEFLTMIW
jgi:hypothetical protein